ncbi:MAG: hypothetical protein H6797_04595 [Candidatus Nomurabacteria bacterium]|nr:MAG: hypothetical protein H6797_04595 [Candidatus Nomurabacteria bacterium]
MKWSKKAVLKKSRMALRSLNNYQRGLFAVFALWGGYFIWLWVNVFRNDSKGDIVSGHSLLWADWASHLSYASVFAYRAPHDWFLAHPLFAGAKFTYPFLPDALSGLLMRTGVGVVPSFIVPSIFMTIIMLYVLYRFAYHFTGRVKSAVVALSLFLLSGGLGFLYYLSEYGVTHEWYTHMPEHGIYFINFVVGEMLPQRNFLFGLPIALSIILILERMVAKKASVYQAVCAGLLAGILTIIHPHSLIVVVIVSAVYLLRYRRQYGLFLWYALVAEIGIGAYWYFLLLNSGSGSLPHWQLGWMSAGHNLLGFELLNFGILLPLGVYSAWRQKWLSHPLFISALGIFTVCHFVSFQVWEWDNTKLFTYSYLFLLIPIVMQLLAWWDQRRRYEEKVLTVVCVVLLGGSGLLDIVHMSQFDTHTYTLVQATDYQAVAHFRSIAPSGAIIIDSQKSDQPYTMLSNTQALMAYDGWLWSYGIDYTQVRQDIGEIVSGSDNAKKLLAYYRVSYIVVDDELRRAYQVNDHFLAQFPVVQSTRGTIVYQVTRSK